MERPTWKEQHLQQRLIIMAGNLVAIAPSEMIVALLFTQLLEAIERRLLAFCEMAQMRRGILVGVDLAKISVGHFEIKYDPDKVENAHWGAREGNVYAQGFIYRQDMQKCLLIDVV